MRWYSRLVLLLVGAAFCLTGPPAQAADPAICRVEDLSLSGSWAHAAANLADAFALRNAGSTVCTLLPPVSVEVSDPDTGALLPATITNRFSPAQVVTLAPNQEVTFGFGWFDSYCGPQPANGLVDLRLTATGSAYVLHGVPVPGSCFYHDVPGGLLSVGPFGSMSLVPARKRLPLTGTGGRSLCQSLLLAELATLGAPCAVLGAVLARRSSAAGQQS